MKYIDADLLRERIKKNQYVIEPLFTKGDDSYYEGEYDGYNRVLQIIDYFQQEQQDCHTVEDWMQHIKNADQLTKDIFSNGPYDVLYDALNHPYQHCYDAIKEFGELCFQTGVNSVKQEQQEAELERDAVQFCFDKGFNVTPYQAKMIASHFYELGKNSK